MTTTAWADVGRTRFYCFTRPGTAVRFLPEQLAPMPELGNRA
jgi:hypothetical protein